MKTEEKINSVHSVSPYGLAALFGRISSTYELVNHLLTFGLDVYWRWRAIGAISKIQGSLWLDVCTGTGSMARGLMKKAPKETIIVALDFCWPMLFKLRRKLQPDSPLKLIMAQANSLPFPHNSVDLITLAFATRNLFISQKHLMRCFQEFHRVLKPGGLFLNLETSQPRHPLFRCAYHFYVRQFVRPLGQMISGDKAAYSYLARTIPRFLHGEALKEYLFEAGFRQVTVIPLTGGLVAIHLAYK